MTELILLIEVDGPDVPLAIRLHFVRDEVITA